MDGLGKELLQIVAVRIDHELTYGTQLPDRGQWKRKGEIMTSESQSVGPGSVER
jgi:hypothetical protein